MVGGYTIRILVADGDPDGVREVDRMNWTGLGIVFPRDQWTKVKERDARKQHPVLSYPGVYLLDGPDESDPDKPKLYIGEADDVRQRIEQQHERVFWDRCAVFVSTNYSLNKAHVKWIEHELHKRALAAGRAIIANGNIPPRPSLHEVDETDAASFLQEILRILPLIDLRALEEPKVVAEPKSGSVPAAGPFTGPLTEIDTIVVPAKPEGFHAVFLGEAKWRAIRIAGGNLHKIEWIAAYQVAPISAITHIAPIEKIELFGEGGKYQLVFAEPASVLPQPIPLGNALPGAMQGPRYTTYEKLMAAQQVADL
ncbi:MAG: GIY-YIG nuclease family protein [bacterium]|nr:GIY-YIG nuclease family protein [bacterium]